MEKVLDIYSSPHDPDHPVICMDEAAKQMISDSQPSVPMKPGRPVLEDYHYERHDVAAIFMFFDPFGGWRRACATESRTRHDWAHQVQQLLEVDFPAARKVTLVCDNLNTHDIGSLYHAFPAAKAHELVQRLDIQHTPRGGSWLNMAEIELGILGKQCLDRRIASIQELNTQIRQWNIHRNATKSVVHWRFTTKDARIKLSRLYPHF